MLRLLGGEIQQTSLNSSMGYSVKARMHRKPRAYLEPNSNRLQKPIGGLSYWRFSLSIAC